MVSCFFLGAIFRLNAQIKFASAMAIFVPVFAVFTLILNHLEKPLLALDHQPRYLLGL